METAEGADQAAAIRKVREAVMTANAAIACGGKQVSGARRQAPGKWVMGQFEIGDLKDE